MSSQSQFTANQLNAQKSTGPRSVEGKAVCRFNSLKHGIDARCLVIPGEDPEELAALANDYNRQFQPDGPVEAMLVRTLIHSDWYLRRYARIEASIITRAVGGQNPAIAVPAMFDIASAKSNPLPHLFRRRQAAQRDWFRALKELQRLQKERRPAEQPEETKEAAPAVGFALPGQATIVPVALAAPAPDPKPAG